MSGGEAVVWFIITTIVVFAVLAGGIFVAARSYDKGRGVIHLRHRH